MSGKLTDAGVGVGVSVLAVVCCLGLPLLLAAAAGTALAVWIGGLIVGAVVLVALVALLADRARR